MSHDTKANYRIEDARQRKRVSEFEAIADPTDRRSEIAAARAMLEQAFNAGNHSVANSLLANLDRLQKNCFREEVIRHKLLTRDAVNRFMLRVVEVIHEILSRRFPNGEWEDAMLELSEQIDDCFAELRNDGKEVEGLKLPR